MVKRVMVGKASEVPWVLTTNIIDSEEQYVFIVGKVGIQEVIVVGIYAPNRQQYNFGRKYLHIYSNMLHKGL